MNNDITMCRDSSCKANLSCKRYITAPDKYQSYFCESPRKGDSCEMFWGVQAEYVFNYLESVCKGEKK
jgi:hypothetical protein